jgi:hypothetical protein
MPIYIYKHPEKEEYKEIIQTMREKHVYSEDGVEWKRVFTIPNASIDTKVDAYDKNAFISKTGNMKGTVGDMLDYSADMSRKRAEKSETGEDPVKRAYFNEYQSKIGKKHLDDKKKVIETSKFKVELD